MVGLFITGTDTGCGKTRVALGMMQKLQQQGNTVLGMKPIASGAEMTQQGLRNEDAVRIRSQASIEVPYELINPYVYEPAIAPHLAAAQVEKPILIEEILQEYQRLSNQADQVLIEGVGGWHVPLGEHDTLADLARALNLPVVMVVGLRLGCLNHALMTAECMLNAGVTFAGWIANQTEQKMPAREENLATLQAWLPAPCLGDIPYLPDPGPQTIASYLSGHLSELFPQVPEPCQSD
jgi:dethiobiotin synthetase